MAFQAMFPMATIGYISALPPGLIAEGHEILVSRVPARLPSRLGSGFPPSRPASPVYSGSLCGGRICYFAQRCPFSVDNHYQFVFAIGCSSFSFGIAWRERSSSMVVAPPQCHGILPVEHPTTQRPDPEGLDDSFLDYHGGSR